MRHRIWLLAAALLLGLAAWLMSRGDPKPARAQAPRVEFPRHLRPAENERLNRRRTLAPPRPTPDKPFTWARDPLLVAMPNKPGTSVVVFEAALIRDTPIAQYYMDCFQTRTRRQTRKLREHGIDVETDIDRVAVAKDVVVVSGGFDNAQWEALSEDFSRRGYGEHGVIFERPDGRSSLSVWRNELILMGRDVAAIEEAIDRLETDGPAPESIISDTDTYGDVYGVISPEDLAQMLPEEYARLADAIRSSAKRIELHVDATEDVAIVADVRGSDPSGMQELGKSLGAALAIGRMQAQSDGDSSLDELLELARVRRQGETDFTTELALPLPLLKDRLGPCRKDDPDGEQDDSDAPEHRGGSGIEQRNPRQ